MVPKDRLKIMLVSDEFIDLVSDFLLYSSIFAFLLSWLKIRLPEYLLCLRVLFIISFIATPLLTFLGKLYGNSLYINTSYIILEFLLLSRLYWLQTPDDRARSFIKYVSISLLIFSLVNLFFIEGVYSGNSYSRSATSFATIIFSILYFWIILSQLKIENLFKESMFWINSGILMLAAGSFVIFLVVTDLIQSKNYDLANAFWTSKNFVAIIRNLFFAYAFWLNYKLGFQSTKQ